GIWITPCESWPTRLAPTMWRMTSAASSGGVPAAMNNSRPISSRRSADSFGMSGPSLRLRGGSGGGLAQMRVAHGPQLGRVQRLGIGVADEGLVFRRHRRRRHLDHQAVLDPEFDDVKKRLAAGNPAPEQPGAPALAGADALDLLPLQRHFEQQVEGMGARRLRALVEDRRLLAREGEHRVFRIDLDHRAVAVAGDG